MTDGVSQVGAAPLVQVAQRLLTQGVKTPGGNIRLELPVPSISVEIHEPTPKSGKLLA